MYDPKVPVSKVPKAPPEIQLLINSIFLLSKENSTCSGRTEEETSVFGIQIP